ncbi:MAG: hypothetical protein SVY15_07665 [Halobacteriota archaeon]|nr:hypothetical protein [Halobacteriota archaeon]
MMRDVYKKPEMRSEAIDIGVYGQYAPGYLQITAGIFCGPCCE